MKTNQTLVLAAILGVALSVQASGWRFSAGPAWRSQIDVDIKGNTENSYADTTYRDLESGNWREHASEAVAKPDPLDDGQGTIVPAGSTLYAIDASYTETTVAYDGADNPSACGLKTRLGYDFIENDAISVGLDLRFAGYWNMKSSANATKSSRTITDRWFFEDGPYPGMGPSVADDPDTRAPKRNSGSRQTTTPIIDAAGGRALHSRLCADLYQVGLGPTVTWHAFSWLDAYASAAVLCNIASIDFDVGTSSQSDAQCRLGFAGEVGLAAYLTENIGIYAEVGYEWIDDFDASVNAFSTDIDFSSVVVSAGIAFKF